MNLLTPGHCTFYDSAEVEDGLRSVWGSLSVDVGYVFWVIGYARLTRIRVKQNAVVSFAIGQWTL